MLFGGLLTPVVEVVRITTVKGAAVPDVGTFTTLFVPITRVGEVTVQKLSAGKLGGQTMVTFPEKLLSGTTIMLNVAGLPAITVTDCACGGGPRAMLYVLPVPSSVADTESPAAESVMASEALRAPVWDGLKRTLYVQLALAASMATHEVFAI